MSRLMRISMSVHYSRRSWEISSDGVDRTPFAAASIAQVHHGLLDNGDAVVVKVQRPHVAGTLTTDLRLLAIASQVVARILPSLRRVNITGLVETLSDQLQSELDFTSELDNAQVMEVALVGTDIRVPHCLEELCTSKVLVMEYLIGQPLSACAANIGAAGGGQETARRVLEALLTPLVSQGVFHADMHGGNLLVGPSENLGLVDFGCVTQLDGVASQCLTHALLALFERRFQEAAWGLMSLMDVTNADLDAACLELASVTSVHLDQSIEDVQVGQMIKQLIAIGTNYGIVLPLALLSLMRQRLFLDGLTRELDSTFNFLDEGATVLRVAMGGHALSKVPSVRGAGPTVCAVAA
jgi:ubiquinone biosynthesis protein